MVLSKHWSAMTIVALAAIVASTGCVSVQDPTNYRPQTESISKDFYGCSQENNQPVAGVAWSQYGGSAGAGMKVNSDMLLRCMEAHDYRLRKATTGEWVAAIIFLPLTLPVTLLSAGTYPGSDIRFGGGSAEP